MSPVPIYLNNEKVEMATEVKEFAPTEFELVPNPNNGTPPRCIFIKESEWLRFSAKIKRESIFKRILKKICQIIR